MQLSAIVAGILSSKPPKREHFRLSRQKKEPVSREQATVWARTRWGVQGQKGTK